MALLIQLSIIFMLLAIGLYCALEHYRNSNIIVLGTGKKAEKVLQDLEFNGYPSRYTVLGFVKSHANENSIPSKLRYNTERNLLSLAKGLKASTLVIAVDQRISSEWIQQILDCKLSGITVIDASALTILAKKSGSIFESSLHAPERV